MVGCMPRTVPIWKALLVSFACAFLALGWQFLTVRYNYHGDWSGLFYTGDHATTSPAVAAEHPYEFAGTPGWDGQFYHEIAHDPVLQRGTAPYIDAARLRYRRILIPALAYLLAAGNDAFVDPAYHAVIILFLAMGGWWLARLMRAAGRPEFLGIAFLFLPASIASIDRQAVDAGLLCFCCAFALYTRYLNNPRALYLVLLFGPLVRDTGLLLTAAYCVWLLFRRDFRKCALFATTAAPTIAWYLFVNSRTMPYSGDGALALPFTGVVDRLIHPMDYTSTSLEVALTRGADALAAAGVLVAMILAFRFVWRRRPDPVEIAIVLFALLGIVVWRPGDWPQVLDYGRILSPLLFFEALVCLEDGFRWLNVAPLCMVLPRFGIEMGPQVIGVVKGLLAGA
jgi:hypothetical protein